MQCAPVLLLGEELGTSTDERKKTWPETSQIFLQADHCFLLKQQVLVLDEFTQKSVEQLPHKTIHYFRDFAVFVTVNLDPWFILFFYFCLGGGGGCLFIMFSLQFSCYFYVISIFFI